MCYTPLMPEVPSEVVVIPAFVDAEEIRAETRKELVGIALQTYRDLMLNAPSDLARKGACDAVMEIVGAKIKATANADFHFNVPAEYLQKVFAGVGQVTERTVTPVKEGEKDE